MIQNASVNISTFIYITPFGLDGVIKILLSQHMMKRDSE